jgi:tRNA A-37 threonylcarbamoyl transferase component Bud32/Arc/MetJ-type ribon-helix-helix transcriptional regulator
MAFNPRKLEPGTRLGQFTIRERLGRGATATAYKAEEQGSGALVALKVLHADADDGGEHRVERLQREVVLARRLTHPGICRVFELHNEGGVLFLSMQLLTGFSLETVFETEGKLLPPRAATIVAAVCSALSDAHAIGILHRDLKPGNIMLRPGDSPSILDFGYATGPDVGRLTRTGIWVGTLNYAAPELLKGEKASSSTDLYALGVILYQALTGELPFCGHSYGETASAILRGEFIAPRLLSPSVPVALERIVEKSLKSERERFASAADLAAALADLRRAVRVKPSPPATPAAGRPESAGEPRRALQPTTAGRRVRHATVLVVKSAAPDQRGWREPLEAHLHEWGGTLGVVGPEAVGGSFPSADDAVRAAMAMLHEREREGDVAALRAGLATGDALWQGRDLGGDAALVATSACDAASGGDILLASSTHSAILAPSLGQAFKPATRLEAAGGVVELLRWTACDSAKTAIFVNPLASPRVVEPPPVEPAAAPATPMPPPAVPPATRGMKPQLTPPGAAGALRGGSSPVAKAAAPRIGAEVNRARGAAAAAVAGAASPVGPAAAAAVAKAGDAVALRATHEQLVAEVKRLRLSKGILPGDDATLESLERTAGLALSRGRLQESCEWLRRAVAQAEALVVDGNYLRTKLHRFDRAFREQGGLRDMDRFAPMLDGVMRAFNDGDFVAANRALNDAFGMLAGRS